MTISEQTKRLHSSEEVLQARAVAFVQSHSWAAIIMPMFDRGTSAAGGRARYIHCNVASSQTEWETIDPRRYIDGIGGGVL
jgi:hypothetical protein